ncbi:type I-C CRISPR-associated protein Cas8c/Csd1 [Piscinibacter sp.]|uniref:type I-C CRISPR-associated protein Cas8c/Csd1 n=1 Tax=Piscinibacter sp. TaxID=1903157 RepID=UPI002C80CB26|nr:type I-C CRISPR-associated protein Cas8c/Csd1 [Albitalea sp.]HUG26114.1 type I-C CRISPR-associated protein Cas8c/Csd1 [Albitalea sp.]
MILQALSEYYARKAAADQASIAPEGLERKEIPFVIVLDSKGQFLGLEDTRTGEGKKKRGRAFAVPQAVTRTVAVSANLLWDNTSYVLGVSAKVKPERIRQQHAAFIATIRERIPDADTDEGVRAVLRFLEASEFAPVFAHPLWLEVMDSTGNMSFRLEGDNQLVCQRPAVLAAVQAVVSGATAQGKTCLVTGTLDTPARLHPPIKGVANARSSGASLVSFNLAAFNSFGNEQGANAPVGERAAFAYTTALNNLLARDSRQRLMLGDATTVFWAERAHVLEDSLAAWLGEPPKDNPDQRSEALKALYEAPRSGAFAIDEQDKTRFYVLGLAPNAARISVRFWWTGTAGELAARIRQHFDDLHIAHDRPGDAPHLSVFRLLVSTATLGKADNIRPNLAGAVVRSIFEGTEYPRELLGAAMQRIRAEGGAVTYARAALIKACLTREARLQSRQTTTPEVSVSLDPINPNTAYRLGRLFAVLERAQEAASPGINATIRDRYFGAASATPVTVFPRLLKLNTHHLSKLDNRGQAVNLEKQIGQIIDGVNDFPPLLSLADQGRFSIGYYHQRQSFYTRKEPNTQPEA